MIMSFFCIQTNVHTPHSLPFLLTDHFMSMSRLSRTLLKSFYHTEVIECARRIPCFCLQRMSTIILQCFTFYLHESLEKCSAMFTWKSPRNSRVTEINVDHSDVINVGYSLRPLSCGDLDALIPMAPCVRSR